MVSVDVSRRVSQALSEILNTQVNDPEAVQPATLGSVRVVLVNGELHDTYQADRLHPATTTNALAELDALIDEFGVEAPAQDFVAMEASEELTHVIQALLDTGTRPPSLWVVKAAMETGLVARLVGEGAIDPDDDDTLQEEIDALIRLHGADTPAEQFLRYD